MNQPITRRAFTKASAGRQESRPPRRRIDANLDSECFRNGRQTIKIALIGCGLRHGTRRKPCKRKVRETLGNGRLV